MEECSTSGSGGLAYDSHCEVVHVDDSTYHTSKQRKSRNRILSSYLTSVEDEIRPHGLGIKFASEGQETYWLQGRRYQVSDGKYLLVNGSVSALDVTIQQTPTASVCVDIDPALVNDALLQLLHPNDPDSYHNLSRYLLTPELFMREATAGSPLQVLLTDLISASANQQLHRPAMELIYELTTLIVQENTALVQSYYKLQPAKLSTQKELFRRLLIGKEVLDDSLFTELSIKTVSDTCCLSEFRFYRLFKQCFGDTPYNYLFRKRINKSIELHQLGYSWAEVAELLNFTDLAAFSKGFKKVKGVAPTKFIL